MSSMRQVVESMMRRQWPERTEHTANCGGISFTLCNQGTQHIQDRVCITLLNDALEMENEAVHRLLWGYPAPVSSAGLERLNLVHAGHSDVDGIQMSRSLVVEGGIFKTAGLRQRNIGSGSPKDVLEPEVDTGDVALLFADGCLAVRLHPHGLHSALQQLCIADGQRFLGDDAFEHGMVQHRVLGRGQSCKVGTVLALREACGRLAGAHCGGVLGSLLLALFILPGLLLLHAPGLRLFDLSLQIVGKFGCSAFGEGCVASCLGGLVHFLLLLTGWMVSRNGNSVFCAATRVLLVQLPLGCHGCQLATLESRGEASLPGQMKG